MAALLPATSIAQREGLSAEAEALYGRVHDKVLQIRVLHRITQSQAATGSAFFASRDGLIVTNYHVVARAVREPLVYGIEFVRSNGEKGRATVRAFDVANDLAVLASESDALSFLRLHTAPVRKGERSFSMGHPLQLGLTIVEGTYNGAQDRDFRGRIHYTGAINLGMSGGPALTGDGRVIGVNVARHARGQLVSLLVPPDRAAALLKRAAAAGAPGEAAPDIGRQLTSYQDRVMREILGAPRRTVRFGPYEVAEIDLPFVRCWGDSGDDPDRLYQTDAKRCASDTSVFVDDDVQTVEVSYAYQLLRSETLGPLRFARLVDQQFGRDFGGTPTSRKEFTAFRCHDDFVLVAERRDVLRVALCARAYRAFPNLYDLRVRAVTLDSTRHALLATVSVSGASFDNGLGLVRRLVESITWTQ